MRLSDGLTVEPAINNRTGELVFNVVWTEEFFIRLVLSIIDERINSAEVALKVCKHSKRKQRLVKLYGVLIRAHKEYTDKLNSLVDSELPTQYEGSE